MKRITAALLAMLLVLAGCSETTDQDPLPWLRVKTTVHKGFGGFSDGSREYAYYVKRLGFFWMKLDEVATGPAVVLGPDVAAISTSQGLKLLTRGEEHGTLACGSPQVGFAIIAKAGVIDCYDVVAGPAAAVASQIRWRRISGHGEALVVEKVSVENPNRLFARAMASFYDSGHQPYFVTMNADYQGPAECALVWIAGGEMHSIPAPTPLSRGACSDTKSWAPVVKRELRPA